MIRLYTNVGCELLCYYDGLLRPGTILSVSRPFRAPFEIDEWDDKQNCFYAHSHDGTVARFFLYPPTDGRFYGSKT